MPARRRTGRPRDARRDADGRYRRVMTRARPGRRRQRGTIDELPSGALCVRVYAGTDPVSGRRHDLVEVVPAGPQAERLAEEARTKLLNQVDERRNPRTIATVDQLLDKYLETLDVGRTTHRMYTRYLEKHVRPFVGRLKARGRCRGAGLAVSRAAPLPGGDGGSRRVVRRRQARGTGRHLRPPDPCQARRRPGQARQCRRPLPPGGGATRTISAASEIAQRRRNALPTPRGPRERLRQVWHVLAAYAPWEWRDLAEVWELGAHLLDTARDRVIDAGAEQDPHARARLLAATNHTVTTDILGSFLPDDVQQERAAELANDLDDIDRRFERGS